MDTERMVVCELGNPRIEECRDCIHLGKHHPWIIRDNKSCTVNHGCTRFESDLIGQARCVKVTE